MNKLNITGNTFPLTVENLQVLQSQTELIQSALLASINKAYSGVATSLYLIVDNKENIVCAYYMNELYAVVNRGDMTKAFIVEKNVSVSTDTETFSNIRTERYVVLGNKEANETIKKTFYNTGTTKNIETINLISNLTKKISEAQSTADTASTTATAAQNTAASAMNKAIEAADAAATAQETANAASSVANSATTTANNASAKANTASNKANTALENSNTAISTANSASEKANTATSTANSAKTAVDDALSIRTFIVRGDGHELPNVSIMGTLTCDYKKKYAYLNFKCWTDGNFIAHINVLQAGSGVNFTGLMNLSLPNNNFSGNNVAYYQTIKATESPNNSIIDFNLLVKPGYFEKITNLISDNKELVLDVTIPE